MSAIPNKIGFDKAGYFYDMVMSFMVAVGGMPSIFEPSNPMKFKSDSVISLNGKVHKELIVDQYALHQQAVWQNINTVAVVNNLTCMLVNTSFEAVSHFNDHSPEFEFFRHVRNAASHKNHFNFRATEPKRPTAWRGASIDHTLKGQGNPLYGQVCFGNLIAAADAILLLWDIENVIGQQTNSAGVSVSPGQVSSTCESVRTMNHLPGKIYEFGVDLTSRLNRDILVCVVPELSVGEWTRQGLNDLRNLLTRSDLNAKVSARESTLVTPLDRQIPIVIFINSNRAPAVLIPEIIARELARADMRSSTWRIPVTTEATPAPEHLEVIESAVSELEIDRRLRERCIDVSRYTEFRATFDFENLKAGYNNFLSFISPEEVRETCAATMVARALITSAADQQEAGAILKLLPTRISTLAEKYVDILKSALVDLNFERAVLEMATMRGIEPTKVAFPAVT